MKWTNYLKSTTYQNDTKRDRKLNSFVSIKEIDFIINIFQQKKLHSHYEIDRVTH